MPVLTDLVAVPVLVRAGKDNRFHLRYRLFRQQVSRSGLVFPSEEALRTVDDGRCGADENWVDADPDLLEDVEPTRLCGFCFPT